MRGFSNYLRKAVTWGLLSGLALWGAFALIGVQGSFTNVAVPVFAVGVALFVGIAASQNPRNRAGSSGKG